MSDDIAAYVRENHDIIAGVLQYSQDPYARACALVLLTYGGSKRDVKAIKEEIERCA